MLYCFNQFTGQRERTILENKLPEQEYVDVDAALARVRGNKALYNKMLGLFLSSGEFAAFEEQLAAGEYAKASETAHAIKGMTGNLSLTKIFTTSAELMVQLRQGPPDGAMLAAYRDAVEKTRAIVERIVAGEG